MANTQLPDNSVRVNAEDLIDKKEDIAIVERPVEVTEEELISPVTDETESIIGGRQLAPSYENVQTENFKPSSLDAGYRFGYSLDAHRAKNQSSLDKFGNFVAQGLLDGVVGQTIGAVGAIGGIAEVIYDKAVGNPSSDFDNIMMQWAEDLKDVAQENFPIYKKDPNETFAIKDFGWWMQGGVSIFSTVGLLLPGMAAGKVSGMGATQVAKMLQLGSKTTNITEALAQIGGAALVQRNAEGFMESGQLAKTTRETLMTEWQDEEAWNKAVTSSAAKELDALGEVITKESLSNYVAAKAGWRAYTIDNANLVFDMVQIAPLFKSTSKLFSGIKLPAISTSKKALQPLAKGFNKFGATVLRQSTEAIEESVNFVASEEGAFYGQELLDKEKNINVATRMGDYLQDGHFWESAFWGFGGGIAFEGATRGIQAIQKKVAGEDNKITPAKYFTLQKLQERKAYIDHISKTITGYENNIGYSYDKDGNEVETDLSSLPKEVKEFNINQTKLSSAIQLGIIQAEMNKVDGTIGQIDDKTFDAMFEESGTLTPEQVSAEKDNIKAGIVKGEQLFNKASDIVERISTEDVKVKQQILNKTVANLFKREINKYHTTEYKKITDTLKSESESYNDAIKKNLNATIFLEKEAIDYTLASLAELKEGAKGILMNEDTSFKEIEKTLKQKQLELNKTIAGIKEDIYTVPKNDKEINDILEMESSYLFHDALQSELVKDTNKIGNDSYIETAKQDIKSNEEKNQKDQLNNLRASLALVKVPKNSSTVDIDNAIERLKEEKLTHKNNPEALKLIDDKINEVTRAKKVRTARKKDVSESQEQFDKAVVAEQVEFDENVPEHTNSVNILDDEDGAEPTVSTDIKSREDIEKRRQEELAAGTTFQSIQIGDTLEIFSYENKGFKEEKIGEKVIQSIAPGDIVFTDGTRISVLGVNYRIKNFIEKVNAKYDAEIAALEEEVLPPIVSNVTGEVSDKDNEEQTSIVNSTVNLADIKANVTPVTVTEEIEEETPEVTTNVVLAVKERELATIKNLNDKGDKVISNQDGIYDVLAGKYRVGDTVSIRPVLDDGKQSTSENITLEILGKDNKVIAYVNTLDSKRKFVAQEEGRINSKEGATSDKDKLYIKGLKDELQALADLRLHIFNTAASFALAPYKTSVKTLNSGSIINNEFQQGIKEAFGDNIVLYKVAANNDQILEPINRKDIDAHVRQAEEGSVLNNIDAIYTRGIFSTLVESPNGKMFPIPLQTSTLSEPFANKVYQGLIYIANEITGKRLQSNDEIVTRAKEVINQIAYTGEGNIEVYNANIKITTTFDKDTNSYKAVKLWYNKVDSSGRPSLVLQEELINAKTKKFTVVATHKNPEKIEQVLKEYLSQLLFNPVVSKINKKGTYMNPLNVEFDGTFPENAQTYPTYLDYITDNNILTTNVGTVKDQQGNIVSNFAVKGKSNLVLGISTAIPKKQKQVVVPKSDSIKEDNTSITSKIFSPFSSFTQLAKDLKLPTTFSYLYEYADKAGIKITNKSKVTGVAGINTKSKNISFNKDVLALRESEGKGTAYIEEVLAHEIVHGFILNEVVDTKRLDKELLQFINSVKANLDSAPTSVKSLYKYIESSSPQEVLAIAYTNKAFASWLQSIPSNVEPTNSSKNLLTDFIDYIKNLITEVTGETKLTELNNIVNANLSEAQSKIDFDSLDNSEGDSIFKDELGDFLGFPSIGKTSKTTEITRKETKDTVETLIAFFTQVSQNEKYKEYNEEQYKQEFKKLLIGIAKSPTYTLKDNMSKVINNYDDIWDLVLQEINNKQKLSFSNESLEESQEFILEKSFDDSTGALETNAKDNIPNIVKTAIKRTPIVLSFDKDGKPIYDKNNFLGLPKFMDFDIYYPYLQDKLADINDSKDLIQRLENLAVFIPSFQLLLNNIKEDQNLLSGWVSHFDKQKVSFIKEIVNYYNEIIGHSSVKSTVNNPIDILSNKWKQSILNNINEEAYNLASIKGKNANLKSKFKDFKKNKQEVIETIAELYDEVGLTYKDINIEFIIENEINNKENLKKYGTPSNIVYKLFIDKFQNILDNVNQNKFDNYGDLSSLATTLEKYTVIPLQNTFLSITGKPKYAITLPNFLSKFFKKFNNKDNSKIKDMVELYSKVPSMRFSNWLSAMHTKNEDGSIEINEEFVDNFSYSISDGIRETNSSLGTDYKNLTEIDWDLLNLMKFNKKPSKGTKSFYETSILIPADSSNIYNMNVPYYATLFGKNSTQSPSYKAVKNIVYQEIQAMKQAKDLLFDVSETGEIIRLKEDLDTTTLQNNYHYTLDKQGNKQFIDQDGNPTGKVFKFHAIEKLNDTELVYKGSINEILTDKEVNDILNDTVSEFIYEDIFTPAVKNFEYLKKNSYNLIFDEPYTGSREDLALKNRKWQNYISNYAINEFITNAEMFNFFYGNIAEYSSKIDIGKRLKEVVAPGIAQSDIGKANFTVVTLNDIILDSENVINIAETISEAIKETKKYTKQESSFSIENALNSPQSLLEKDVNNFINQYKNINTTDAQGYITLDRFREIYFKEGRLTTKMIALIDKAKAGEKLNLEELEVFLEPVKGFYYNRYYDETLNKLVSKQIKYSTFPLIPQFTKGLDLDKIRVYLEKNNIDEAVYNSTTKVGLRDSTTIADEQGNLIEANLNNLSVETLDNTYWQRQLDVPDDILDKEKLLGVQIARIVFGNTLDNVDFNLYSEILEANLFEDQLKTIDELGIGIDEEGEVNSINYDKVRALIETSIKDQNLNKSLLESIQAKSITDKSFRLPLFSSALTKKFQSIFLATFTKNVTNQKLPGFSAVQFSSAFVQRTQGQSIESYTSNYITEKNPSEPLTIKMENGKIIMEVLAPIYDSKFIENGNVIDINALSEEARTIVGYRIPSDALHSTVIFKVVGFLPREMSSSIIVPKEIVVQMGSDFDVDKLFIFRKHLIKPKNEKYLIDSIKYDDEKSATSQSKEARQNRIIDIFIDKISDVSNIDETLKPSSFQKMEEIQKLMPDQDTNLNIFTYTGQKELRRRNLSGQALTGIAANFNTFTFLAQKAQLNIPPIVVKYDKSDVDVSYIKSNFNVIEEDASTITVGHNLLAKNNSSFLNINKDLINEVIGETLATAVDTVKKPILPSFNITSFTYPVFATGLLAGVDHKVQGLFMAQPIIKELDNAYFKSQSDILGSTDFYLKVIKDRNLAKLLQAQGKKLTVYKDIQKQDSEKAREYLQYNIYDTNLNLKELQKGINTNVGELTNTDLQEYYAQQLRYLYAFEAQMKVSNELTSLIGATKVDNKQVGPTISVTQELATNINRLDKQVTIKGVTVDSAYIQQDGVNAIKVIYPEQFGLEQPSVYPPLQEYLSRSSLTGIELSKNFFIQNTDSFNWIVQDIINTSRMKYTIKNIEKVNNFVTSSITARTEVLVNTNYEQILGIDKELISTAKKLYQVKNNPKYKELIEDSTNILFYLEPKLTGDIQTIGYKSVQDSLLESLIYDSFEDLYKSNDPVLNELAIELVKYSFITNGLSFGLSSFSSLIPISMYEDLGIVKELDNAHKTALGGSSFTIDQFSKDIYFRNAWNDVDVIPIVPTKKLSRLGDTGIIKFTNLQKTSSYLTDAEYIRTKKYRKATKEELKASPSKKVILDSDNIYQLLGTELNKEGEVVNKYYYPVPKLGTKEYIDFYNNINNKSKTDLYKELPYSNLEEALDVLEQAKPGIILGFPDEVDSIEDIAAEETEESETLEVKDLSPKSLASLNSFMETRILNVEKQIIRFKSSDFSKVNKNLINELLELDTAQKLVALTQHISRRVKGVSIKLDIVEENKEPSLDNIKKLKNSFTVINSFKDLLNLNFFDLKREAKEKNQKELYAALVGLESTIKPLIELTPRAKELSEEVLRAKLEPLSSNPDIIKGAVDLLRDQNDENQIQGFLDALADSNNTFVALIVKDLNIALDRRNLETQRKSKEYTSKFNKFTDAGYKFDDLLMKDSNGKTLPNLITEFDYIKFQDSKEQMYAEVKKLHIEQEGLNPETKAFKVLESQIKRTKGLWYSRNQRVIPNIEEVKKAKQKELTLEEYEDWLESNTIKGLRETYYTGELVQPNPSLYGVAAYKTLIDPKTAREQERLDFYNYYRELMKELVQNNSRTFLDNGSIPAVPLDNRTQWQAIKEDVLRVRNNKNIDDDRAKLVNVDEAGNITSILVQPYLKKAFNFELLKEDDPTLSVAERKQRVDDNLEAKRKHRRLSIEDLNMDMSVVMPEFIKTSINFNTRKDFEDEILLAKEILGSSKVKGKKNAFDRVATQMTGKKKSIIIDGSQSNVYKHLDKYIKMVFYDDFEEQENENLVRISSMLQNYTSLTQIGFNPFVGINNKVYGTMQNIIESSGGYFFDGDAYRKAMKFYNNGDSLLAYMSGRHNPESSTLQEGIIKTFGIYQSQNELSGKKGNPITGALDKYKYINDIVYGMQTLGEHSMQNVSLFAMMHSHRVIDGKARTYKDYVDSKMEKITDKNRSKAKEIIENNKRLREELKKDFDKLPRVVDIYELADGYIRVKDEFNFSDEAFSEFRQRVIGVNQYMHGIYVKEDAGTIQAYALGRLALQMKKWMRPGFTRRYGTHFGGNFWNERRQAPDEGMYVSTYNFIKDTLKGYNDFALNYKINWNNMSEFQRSNVRKTLMEMSAMVSLYLVYAMAKAGAEDDEDLRASRIFNMFMYQTDRAWKEIALYTPPGIFAESSKLLKSPAASYGTIKNLVQLTNNIVLYPFRNEKERLYQGGMRHGQDKVFSKLIDTLPLANKVERLYNIRRNNEFYSLL